MFWKFVEFLIRLIYFKRFRQADKITRAAELAGQGNLEDALAGLTTLEPELHDSLKSIHALTVGRILGALGRLDEAESALLQAVHADSSSAKARLDLAVIAGRRFRFDDARVILEKLASDPDDETCGEAKEILGLLNQVTSGEREAEFEHRALLMAKKKIGPNGETPGLPAHLALIENWILTAPEAALESADEIALLLGHGEILKGGATWQISLSIEDSQVIDSDSRIMRPFDIIAKRMSSNEASLQTLFKNGWV